MKFETPNFKKQGDARYPQKLEDILPFLKPTKEEVEYNREAGEVANLFLSPETMNEAMSATKKLKKKEPPKREFLREEEEKFDESRAKIAEQLGYKVTFNNGKWFSLKKGGYEITMQHFMSPSPLGYKNGRISEISITSKDGSIEFSGGDVGGSKNKELRKVFDELVNYLN